MYVSALLELLLLMAADTTLDATHRDRGTELLVTDFADSSSEPRWYVVNDNVMGGQSQGGFSLQDGNLRFSGRTNTKGGGFSSIRADLGSLDLSHCGGVRLTVNDGRRYTRRLATDARYRGNEIGYWAGFDAGEGEWRVVDLPFHDFEPRYRGKRLDGPEVEPAKITGMGLMIYDDRNGPFELRLASVQAYLKDAAFTVDQYRWKKRLLVISAPGDGDTELAEMRTARTATTEAFADRDLVLVTLLEDGTSAAGQQVLSTAEAAAVRTTLNLPTQAFALRLIGKDGTVKLSADEAIPVSRIYDLIDTMPMRRSEMSDN